MFVKEIRGNIVNPVPTFCLFLLKSSPKKSKATLEYFITLYISETTFNVAF